MANWDFLSGTQVIDDNGETVDGGADTYDTAKVTLDTNVDSIVKVTVDIIGNPATGGATVVRGTYIAGGGVEEGAGGINSLVLVAQDGTVSNMGTVSIQDDIGTNDQVWVRIVHAGTGTNRWWVKMTVEQRELALTGA
jgi:hypothetical protein